MAKGTLEFDGGNVRFNKDGNAEITFYEGYLSIEPLEETTGVCYMGAIDKTEVADVVKFLTQAPAGTDRPHVRRVSDPCHRCGQRIDFSLPETYGPDTGASSQRLGSTPSLSGTEKGQDNSVPTIRLGIEVMARKLRETWEQHYGSMGRAHWDSGAGRILAESIAGTDEYDLDGDDREEMRAMIHEDFKPGGLVEQMTGWYDKGIQDKADALPAPIASGEDMDLSECPPDLATEIATEATNLIKADVTPCRSMCVDDMAEMYGIIQVVADRRIKSRVVDAPTASIAGDEVDQIEKRHAEDQDQMAAATPKMPSLMRYVRAHSDRATLLRIVKSGVPMVDREKAAECMFKSVAPLSMRGAYHAVDALLASNLLVAVPEVDEEALERLIEKYRMNGNVTDSEFRDAILALFKGAE